MCKDRICYLNTIDFANESACYAALKELNELELSLVCGIWSARARFDITDDGRVFDKVLRRVLQRNHPDPGTRLYLVARYVLTLAAQHGGPGSEDVAVSYLRSQNTHQDDITKKHASQRAMDRIKRADSYGDEASNLNDSLLSPDHSLRDFSPPRRKNTAEFDEEADLWRQRASMIRADRESHQLREFELNKTNMATSVCRLTNMHIFEKIKFLNLLSKFRFKMI